MFNIHFSVDREFISAPFAFQSLSFRFFRSEYQGAAGLIVTIRDLAGAYLSSSDRNVLV